MQRGLGEMVLREDGGGGGGVALRMRKLVPLRGRVVIRDLKLGDTLELSDRGGEGEAILVPLSEIERRREGV